MDAAAGPRAHVRRAAGFFVWSQVEAGHGCPISMTYAAVPALRADPALAAEWTPRLAVDVVRPRAAARRRQGRRCSPGMGMTEKQGGSDVRANIDRGAADRRRTASTPLHGHKWFSLGADERRVPGARPGARRAHLLPGAAGAAGRQPQPASTSQRLKDKLGNRSNASSELELDGTWARRLGDEGRGVRTIIEMVAGDPARLRARLGRR